MRTDERERGCSSSVKLLTDCKEGSLCRVAGLESRLVRVKKVVTVEIGGHLVKDSSLESFGKKRKKRDRSVVVDFRRVEGGFLQERVNSRLLQRVRESAS